MPREVEKEPQRFHESIKSLHITFSELVNVLETIGIDTDLITATSNDAEFEGLDDIKSAPSRFSGKPFVQISKKTIYGSTAWANVEFDIQKTTVHAGRYKGYNPFSAEDNDLAKLIFEELVPFSRPLESWIRRTASWGPFLLAPIFIISFFQFDGFADNGNAKIGTYEITPLISSVVAFIYFALLIIDVVLKKRLPVVHNPRLTFWQKHGETIIVGIILTIITIFLTAYFTNE